MWEKFQKRHEQCEQYREALEDLGPDMNMAEAAMELEAVLAPDVTAHALECESCSEAAETFWASREILAAARESRDARDDARAPWLAARVIAAIAEGEQEGRRAAAEWRNAVAKLASRVVWVSAAALLIASTWLYTPNGPVAGPQGSGSAVESAENTPQYLFDAGAVPANVDDPLASPAER